MSIGMAMLQGEQGENMTVEVICPSCDEPGVRIYQLPDTVKGVCPHCGWDSTRPKR